MYRFTIRDLLWLTVVVALGAFAWVQRRDAREVTAANEKLVAQVEELSERLKNAEWWAGKAACAAARSGMTRECCSAAQSGMSCSSSSGSGRRASCRSSLTS